ncbi:MAG: BamA/TamA family outer membrane protein [Ignavibacteriae bacterium]|nr:BamA/TamA family outer membrane protein [Ignavibacteriota bacterium]
MKFVFCMLILLGIVTHARAREYSDTLLTVRAVMIQGNLTTKDHVILREMKLKPGELITEALVDHDEKRIYSLGLFNKVELEVKPEGEEADVLVQVDERWYIFPYPIIGIRYRDFDKLYYGFGFVHTNFRGRNEKLFASFAFGFDRWVSLTYRNPRLTEDDVSLGFEAKYAKLQSLSVETDVYDQTNLKLGVEMGKRLGLYTSVGGWINYDVWEISEPGLGRTVSDDGRDAFISVGGNFGVNTRDVNDYSTNGYSFVLFGSKHGFGESPVNFFRYGFDARGYTPIYDDVVLAGRTFANFAGGGEVPKYQRVYFGFLERIRGYFKDGREGEHIAGGSTELRIPLLMPRYYQLPFEFVKEFSTLRYGLYLGLFADAGTVWFRGQDVFQRRWFSGYGAGLHFLLPYSFVLRTEYALNMEGRGEFVFDLGAAF